jgi:hypothetical protein
MLLTLLGLLKIHACLFCNYVLLSISCFSGAIVTRVNKIRTLHISFFSYYDGFIFCVGSSILLIPEVFLDLQSPS